MEMPLSKSRMQRINDCLDVMSKRMDEMEVNQKARHDADDRELEEELAESNTISTPTQPFSDSLPEKAHGEGREDQDFWGPPKPKPPIPIEHI
jgi:hypothetical protein